MIIYFYNTHHFVKSLWGHNPDLRMRADCWTVLQGRDVGCSELQEHRLNPWGLAANHQNMATWRGNIFVVSIIKVFINNFVTA